MERFAIDEIKSLLNTDKIETLNNCLIFKVENYKQIIKLIYLSKSFFKIGLVLTKIKLSDFENSFEINDSEFSIIKKLNLETQSMATKFISKNENYKKQDLEREIGTKICTKYNIKVNLSNPTINFYGYIDKTIFMVGIDFSEIDLSKREYKLHNSINSLKGNIAYAAYQILIENEKKISNKTILDPFCDTGITLIESALSQKEMSTNYYRKNIFGILKIKELFDFNILEYIISLDNLKELKTKFIGHDSAIKNVLYSQKNAKVMGLKPIKFTKILFNDIDIKYEEHLFDYIITQPNISFKKTESDKIGKKIENFWIRIDYLLKKNKQSKLVLILKSDRYYLEPIGFKIESKHEIIIGKETNTIIKYKRV